MRRRWWHRAMKADRLLFLGCNATNEALEEARELGGAFQGVSLVNLVGLAVSTIRIRAARPGLKAGGRCVVQLRRSTLGTFLVIGFIIQNITEGLGIIAPILKDRPSLQKLAVMGMIAGTPAIAGAWIGGLSSSQPLTALFLAIGAGTVFEVVYEIGKLIRHDTAKRPMSLTIFAGVTAEMLLLYVTGLLIT
ncbi:MAG: hypothetical protein ABIV47_04535 [Roseiflexaceae bacterium]